jgi:hypothetical protein
MTRKVMKPTLMARQMAYKMPNTMPTMMPNTSVTRNIVHLLPYVASFDALMACIGFLPLPSRK